MPNHMPEKHSMNEIVKALSLKLGLPESAVANGLGLLINFMKQKATGTQFEKFAAMVPGVQQLAASAPIPEAGAGGGGFGGLLGGLLGGQAGDLAKAMSALQQAGIPADKVLPLASGFIDQARTIAGPEAVDGLLDSVPVLKNLLSK